MFNKRKKYNGAVAELLPQLGFSLEETGVFKTLDALDVAWENKWNSWEAALFVAYAAYGGMLKAAEPRAQVVIQQISARSESWVQSGHVQQKLADTFAASAAQWRTRFQQTHGGVAASTTNRDSRLNESRPQSADWIQLFGSAPDVMSRKPENVLHAPGYLLVHVKDVPPIAQRLMSVPSFPLRYIHALAAINEQTTRPMLFVTLEKGLAADPFLCMFRHDGSRHNLGIGTPYLLDNDFLRKALELTREELNIVVNAT